MLATGQFVQRFTIIQITSSPTVVDRSRNASCLSVVSFNCTNVDRNLLLLVTSTSDLSLSLFVCRRPNDP